VDDENAQANPERIAILMRADGRVQERNRQTRELTTYGSHRLRVMELVSSLADQSQNDGRAISILGAGNCLDLDLLELVRTFQQVQLVDLDADALEIGVARQISANDAQAINRIHRLAPVDLAEPLASLTVDDFAEPRLAETCLRLEANDGRCLGLPADRVVSACVLSQIIDALSLLVGQQHPQLPILVQAVRRGHLKRMLDWLDPGGVGLLITDVVSSETAPVLEQMPDDQLPRFLQQCLHAGNFFAGLHPGQMIQDLAHYEPISRLVEDARMHLPWKWQMGPRFYAVYAVSFRRRSGLVPSG
jgi:hypothetical protein